MAITKRSKRAPAHTTNPAKPSLLSRLRNRNQAKVTTTQHTNPITGNTTTTQKTTTHPNGIGSRGHAGDRGPLASNHTTHYTSGTSHAHHKRKPSLGDKVSGGLMKLKGSLTGKSGKKAAGTRRMRGTDGKGARNRRVIA